MKKTTLGLAMCGSFCTFSRVLDAFEALDRERFDLVPIMSQVSFETDSRFGPAAQFRERLEALCGREIVHTIEEAEPFGPKKTSGCARYHAVHRKYARQTGIRHCRRASHTGGKGTSAE